MTALSATTARLLGDLEIVARESGMFGTQVTSSLAGAARTLLAIARSNPKALLAVVAGK